MGNSTKSPSPSYLAQLNSTDHFVFNNWFILNKGRWLNWTYNFSRQSPTPKKSEQTPDHCSELGWFRLPTRWTLVTNITMQRMQHKASLAQTPSYVSVVENTELWFAARYFEFCRNHFFWVALIALRPSGVASILVVLDCWASPDYYRHEFGRRSSRRLREF